MCSKLTQLSSFCFENFKLVLISLVQRFFCQFIFYPFDCLRCILTIFCCCFFLKPRPLRLPIYSSASFSFFAIFFSSSPCLSCQTCSFVPFGCRVEFRSSTFCLLYPPLPVTKCSSLLSACVPFFTSLLPSRCV